MMLHLLSIHVSIGEGHGRVVFIHGITREGADEVGLGAMGIWERLGQSIERFRAHGTLRIALRLLVTLTGRRTHRKSRTINTLSIQKTERPVKYKNGAFEQLMCDRTCD